MNSSVQTAHVIALSEIHDTSSSGTSAVLSDPVNPLHLVKTRLEVRVGEISLTVGELMAAKAHQVFTLDRRTDEPVDLLLEGRVVARGELVAVGDNFAVRITELPILLKP